MWQGRFFSFALDEQYTYYAFAYAENNPVVAKMVKNATDYRYSSARHHAGMIDDEVIADYDIGVLQNEYQDYLQSMTRQKYTETLKSNTHKGLPCGSDDFIKNQSSPTPLNMHKKG